MSSTQDAETIEAFCTYHPLAIPVLRGLGLALSPLTCSLEACCLDGARDIAVVRAAVTAAEEALAGSWRGRPIAELLDHILRTYHRPFGRELAELEVALATARPSAEGAAWKQLVGEIANLRADMELHMEMEEHVLFPWLRDPASTATAPIRAMQLEHADTIHLLLSLEPPAASSPSAAEVVSRLRALESWLCEHLHFESNELIPRALQVEASRR
ncbi:MAG: hemerythrin domain-containing protein [Myxococcales bacterium]|nr:hemerythrin domain-containing protein [Myxococcales bacterium]